MDRREIEFKFQAGSADGKTATIEGMGSVFHNVDQVKDIVLPGAFAETLKARRPKMLLQHGFGAPGPTPIGKWTELEETKEGLRVKGQMYLETDELRLAHRALKDGELDGLSIGYKVLDHKVEGEKRLLKSVDLREVSIVTFPCNEQATVTHVKSLIDTGDFREKHLEQILREAGFSREQAKGICAKGFDGIFPREATEDDLSDTFQHLRGILQ